MAVSSFADLQLCALLVALAASGATSTQELVLLMRLGLVVVPGTL
jgi:hypothetical protein